MKLLNRLRLLDFIVLGLGLALVILVSGAVYSRRGGVAEVRISGVSGEWVYPLDKTAEIEVEGPLGSTWVHIADGKVAIEKSPCKNQTCVASGSISSPDQWVACLPNQVFVRISGDGGGVDAVVQ